MIENYWDIQELKSGIPELKDVADKTVYNLYREYSDTLAAGWMIVDQDEIRYFKNWLQGKL